MLFVQDMYQTSKVDNTIKFTETSKIISRMWKTIDKNIKKEYNDRAKSMNNVNKPVPKKVKEVKAKPYHTF